MNSSIFDSITQDLANKGWSVQDSFWPSNEWQQLAQQAQALAKERLMKPASVGTFQEPQRREKIRSDWIQWIDFDPASDAYRRLESIKNFLNETLFIGLQNWECHLAYYPPGSFYQAHFDQLKGTQRLNGQRMITFILYLNEKWLAGDGGELRMLTESPFLVEPLGGRLVLFRSEMIEHEVQMTNKDRFSLTGWFRKGTL